MIGPSIPLPFAPPLPHLSRSIACYGVGARASIVTALPRRSQRNRLNCKALLTGAIRV
jgi:hypothetical protein